jgi:hypothetical protein
MSNVHIALHHGSAVHRCIEVPVTIKKLAENVKHADTYNEISWQCRTPVAILVRPRVYLSTCKTPDSGF